MSISKDETALDQSVDDQWGRWEEEAYRDSAMMGFKDGGINDRYHDCIVV